MLDPIVCIGKPPIFDITEELDTPSHPSVITGPYREHRLPRMLGINTQVIFDGIPKKENEKPAHSSGPPDAFDYSPLPRGAPIADKIGRCLSVREWCAVVPVGSVIQAASVTAWYQV